MYGPLNDRPGREPASSEQLPPPPAPDTVPGASAIIADGFEPIENLTGAVWIVEIWPSEHKRSVPETRPEWIGEQPEGRMWCIRSPWPGLKASEALSVIWAELPRDGSDEVAAAAEILSYPEDAARRILDDLSAERP